MLPLQHRFGGAPLLRALAHVGGLQLRAGSVFGEHAQAVAGAVATVGDDGHHRLAGQIMGGQKAADRRRCGLVPDGEAQVQRVVGADCGTIARQQVNSTRTYEERS